jgi:hypothetical protein
MSTQIADPMAARDALQSLAAELETRRFAVRLLNREGRTPHLIVTNPEAPVLTENVTVAPDTTGELSFWFPWPGRIALVTEVAAAADRIENVLAEVGR